MNSSSDKELKGARILILTGEWAGHEGICLGRAATGTRHAVSPDESNAVLMLEFEKEFGLLMDLSSDPSAN